MIVRGLMTHYGMRGEEGQIEVNFLNSSFGTYAIHFRIQLAILVQSETPSRIAQASKGYERRRRKAVGTVP